MEQQAIKQKLNELVEKKGLSKNKLAEQLGVSSATLSNIENEHWDKINEEMLLKIGNKLNIHDWAIIKTYNFQTVFATCKQAKERNKMMALIGYTGAGKTIALEMYYNENPNTYYVLSEKSMSAKQFMSAILKSLGVSFNGTIYHIINKIAEELNKQHNPLIIIDEAGKLSQIVLEYLHDLFNKTKNNLGIVLAGVEYFKTNLKKAVRNNKEGMPEFYDRVSSWVELEPIKRDEIRVICDANGITDKEFIKTLYVAKNFRKLNNYIENRIFNQQIA